MHEWFRTCRIILGLRAIRRTRGANVAGSVEQNIPRTKICLEKVLEKMLRHLLHCCLVRRNVFASIFSGFSPGGNIMNLAFDLVKYVEHNGVMATYSCMLYSCSLCPILFLHVPRAFDTLSHINSSQALVELNTTGHALRSLGEFACYRKIFVFTSLRERNRHKHTCM